MSQDFSQFVTSLEQNFAPSEETIFHAAVAIREDVRSYVADRNLKALVIGLHGDLDSSVVATLCQEKHTGVPLLGIVFPSFRRTNQAHWIGRNFCTEYVERVRTNDLVRQLTQDYDKFADYTHPLMHNESQMNFRVWAGMLHDLAQKSDGIVLGSKTWTDMFGTFRYVDGEGDYFPIAGINKGFELPYIAKALNLPKNIIEDTSSEIEDHFGATYREIDVIINHHLGNLDDNLSTQMNRYKSTEAVQRILLRFGFNNMANNVSLNRDMLGLPTKYIFRKG